MTLTHQYTGATIKDLLKKFGTGPKGFYPQTWYKKEAFFTESAPKGEYEIVIDRETCGKTYAEQVEQLKKTKIPCEEKELCGMGCGKKWNEYNPDCPSAYHSIQKQKLEVTHPAVLIEAILTHLEKTGERLLEGWWVRTSAVDSGGDRVHVGYFDGSGLVVYNSWDDNCLDSLGLSASVRLGDLKPGTLVPLETLSLRAKNNLKEKVDALVEALQEVSEALK